MFGWSGKILRVDLSHLRTWTEPVDPYTNLFVGGRGISVKILYDEVRPGVSPYDPENILCLGPGVLTGTPAPSSGRLKVTGVAVGSLLRNAGLGGDIPSQIKWAGYDLIVIQGKSDSPVYLLIHDDNIEFRDATQLWGKDTYETQQAIKDEAGQQFEVMCIGPGGENRLSFASIHTGLGSAAGRCGLGGVMGAKNLKAIGVWGTQGLRLAKPNEFLELAEEQRKSFAGKTDVIESIQRGGEKWIPWDFEQGGTGARGNFEACDWSELHFDKLDSFAEQYSASLHSCTGCPIDHVDIYNLPGTGVGAAKCIGSWSLTGSVWNNDTHLWFRAYNSVNKYGMDVCSTANIIAFLMELYDKGIITAQDTDGIPMKKGDETAILTTIHKLGKQEGFGKIFKDGLTQGAKKLGRGAEEYVMAVKELELQPYEYRAFKQYGLAAATNTTDPLDASSIPVYNWAAAEDQKVKRQAEELAEELYGTREAAIPSSYQGIASATMIEEGKHAVSDMIGVCVLMVPRFMTPYFDVHARLLSLATGQETTEEELLFAGHRVITLERAFHVMRGITRKDDTLPRRLFKEPIPDGPYKGVRLDQEGFQKALDDYYILRGYDKQGIPTRETFDKYGLQSEWKVFKKTLGKEAKAPK